MPAIVHSQLVRYKFWKMIYASIEKVITHYSRVCLTRTIVTTKFAAATIIPSSLPLQLYIPYRLTTLNYAHCEFNSIDDIKRLYKFGQVLMRQIYFLNLFITRK